MLWIVTQNKQRLLNVPGVIVKGKEVRSVPGSGILDALDNQVLGKYESKDRAQEVLEETFAKIEASTSANVIFTMPER